MRKDAAAFQARTDLAVVDQHPADGSEADDDGGGNRPTADADVADGLPLGFALRDLAISCLGVLVLIAHRPRPHLQPHASGVPNLAYVPPVVDRRRPASNDAR